VLQFLCECDVVKDTGKEEYLRPFIHIGLDWICGRFVPGNESACERNVPDTEPFTFCEHGVPSAAQKQSIAARK